MRQLVPVLAAIAGLTACGAASAPAQANPDHITSEQFAARGKALLADAAKSPDGLALAILQKSPNHYAELVSRVKTGGAEVHADWDDVFIFMDGEASEVIGGTVIDPKDTGNGETRGARVTGGKATPIHKGDVLQIAAKTPHQMIIPPGKTVTYYVVKVQIPK